MTTHVHYAEARGDAALPTLRSFLNVLPTHPGLKGAELMWSEAQPGLYLVMSRWDGKLPALTVPEGVTAWAFEIIDER